MGQSRINLNKEGNIVHTTRVEKLPTIIRYGLVSQYHHGYNGSFERTKQGEQFGLKACPCEQLITQEEIDKLTNRGLIFFHAIGARSNSGLTTITNLWQNIWGHMVGLLIRPEDFLIGTAEKKDYELGAFIGDTDALKRKGIREYWEDVMWGAIAHGENRASQDFHQWEYRVSSCIPWKKFSALVVSATQKKRLPLMTKNIISRVRALPKDMQRPVYDTANHLLYSPN